MGKKGKAKKEQDEDAKNEEQTQDQQQADNQKPQPKQQEPDKPKTEVLQPRKIQYCPICTLPFELCKYGKKADECRKFLMEIAPTKVAKYHPGFDAEDQQNDEGKKEDTQKEAEEPKQVKQPKKEKSVKEKYILITVKNRRKEGNKQKVLCQISGLKNFKIESKQFAKSLSKKFACSCSAQDDDKAQVQGEFSEQIKQILVNDYKVKKKYILDKEQFNEKLGEEKEKKKQKKRLEKNAIAEEPEEEEEPEKKELVPEPPVEKKKTAAQSMLEGLSDQQDD